MHASLHHQIKKKKKDYSCMCTLNRAKFPFPPPGPGGPQGPDLLPELLLMAQDPNINITKLIPPT